MFRGARRVWVQWLGLMIAAASGSAAGCQCNLPDPPLIPCEPATVSSAPPWRPVQLRPGGARPGSPSS
jgi:hypothetical protein